MGTKVITITRQFGSMGRLIAQKVADALGFAYFDRDIIEKAAQERGEPVSALSEFDGQMFSTYGKMMFPLGNGLITKQARLFELEKKIMLSVASEHDCVIVGRCSDYIVHEAELKNVYSVFIYAPYNERFNNCLKYLGLTPDSAELYIDKVDAARDKFYRQYTGESFDSIKYRNMLIDSSTLSLDNTVSLICEGAKKKFASNK